jgi:hypothetical protein
VNKRHDRVSQAVYLAQGVVKAKRQVMQYYDDDDDDDDDDNKETRAERLRVQAPRRD